MTRGEIYFQAGVLACLLAVSGFGLLHWYAVLFGWGVGNIGWGLHYMWNEDAA